MLEVHPDPKNAAVDPLQPINFKEFKDLISLSKKTAAAIGRKV